VKRYLLKQLADRTLDRALDTLVAQRCVNTADLIAHLTEFHVRRLYVSAGYWSLYLYCTGRLHFSEQAAYRRISVARTARRFPQVFPALAEGRLHLTAVEMPAPHLIPENVDRLLSAATRKSKSEIERLLARWFPQPDLPASVHALSPLPAGELSLARC
jgi:hypothetical protein